MEALSGGFGTLLCFAHDWASLDKTIRSYELSARYVMPRCRGLVRSVEASAERVRANKAALMEKSVSAIMKAIHDYNAVHPRQK